MATPDRPRVLHVVPRRFGAGGIYGGAERYAWELSRAMAQRVPTRVVAFGTRAGEERQGKLRIFTLRNHLPGRRFEASPAGLGLLPHLAWADVIHCHQIYTMATSVALLYGHACHTPVFATDHGGGGVNLVERFRLERWFAGRLWVSRFSQTLAATMLPGDTVIHGGVDTDRFCPDPETACDDTLVYVGRLLPHKGVDVLIRAAVMARMPLRVIGRPLEPEYFARLRALAQGSEVAFLTNCTDADIVGHYRRALCVVLPSVSQNGKVGYPASELLGQTLLEGMACGAPAIATAVGGMPEVVEEGRTGFLVPASDVDTLAAKMAWLRAHAEERRRMGAAARAHVLAHFTWPVVVERCLAAYGATPGSCG